MSTISENLLSAYRFHRAKPFRAYGDNRRPAEMAIVKAREDVAAYDAAMAAGDTKAAAKARRYASSPWAKSYGAVTWQPDNPKMAYVEKPESAGLRHVGNVEAECGGRNGYFSKRDSCGWYTDPHGFTYRDGTGLCWGVVYQLPARDGKARFVAGYQFGGTDDGPCIDFGTIYEEDRRAGYYSEDAADLDAARDAAYAADSMAQRAAEDERDYQTAWQAGSRYSDCLEELAENRKTVLQTIRDMKGACVALRDLPDALKARLRASIESDLEERESLFSKMRKLASGDYDSLCFYPDERLRSAFNEGAGRVVI